MIIKEIILFDRCDRISNFDTHFMMIALYYEAKTLKKRDILVS